MIAYIEHIAVFIIIESIILRLAANEDYRKMIKICSGMILIIIVLSPLDNAIGFTQLVKEFMQEITGQNEIQELKEEISKSDDNATKRLKTEYEQVMAENLTPIVTEYGYTISDINITFDETSSNYIGNLTLYLTTQNTAETISQQDKTATQDTTASISQQDNTAIQNTADAISQQDNTAIQNTADTISSQDNTTQNTSAITPVAAVTPITITAETPNQSSSATPNTSQSQKTTNSDTPDIMAIKNSIQSTYTIPYEKIDIITIK